MRAVLEGVLTQLRREAKEGEYLHSITAEDQLLPESEGRDLPDWGPDGGEEVGQPTSWHGVSESGKEENPCVDTVTGEELPEHLVREAKDEEVDFMEQWGVGELRPEAEARRVTGRVPVSGKWVVRNKRDHENPLVRCRYMARELSLWKGRQPVRRHPTTGSPTSTHLLGSDPGARRCESRPESTSQEDPPYRRPQGPLARRGGADGVRGPPA